MYLVCRLLLRSPPCHSLFPYTTLFRSRPGGVGHARFERRIDPLDGHEVFAARGADDRLAQNTGRNTRDMRHRAEFLHVGAIVVEAAWLADRKSTRLNSSHRCISYAVSCSAPLRATHSFPTRRSSDLVLAVSVTLGSSAGSIPLTVMKSSLREELTIALPRTPGATPVTCGIARSFSTSAR